MSLHLFETYYPCENFTSPFQGAFIRDNIVIIIYGYFMLQNSFALIR